MGIDIDVRTNRVETDATDMVGLCCFVVVPPLGCESWTLSKVGRSTFCTKMEGQGERPELIIRGGICETRK
jgi:hypothetical protein